MNLDSSTHLKLRKVRWIEAPVGLLMFVVFSFGAVFFALYDQIFASQEFHETVVQHVGWIGTFRYSFFLIMGLSLIYSRSSGARKAMVLLLAVQFVIGVGEWLQRGREDYGNPYLIYGWFRPVWDIALPTLWMLVLSSTSVKSYSEKD